MALLYSIVLLFILFLSDSVLREINSLGIGINYGQIANNLPSPTQVANLLQSIQVTRVKLYDADPNVLHAFANSNVEFIISIGNEYLQSMSSDQTQAQQWIQSHVQPYISQTNITCIVVGNEVFVGSDVQLMSHVYPAMRSVYLALKSLGLSNRVTVTTAHSTGILASSFPPSSGTFKPELSQYLQPMLDFQSQINSPFLLNAYPFFAYKDNPNEVSLDYVLFKPNDGMIDPATNLHYDNMLYAQVDAVYSAMKAMGHGDDITIRISETGWPSKGDPDEIGASVENAGAYNGNLLKRIEKGEGTPGKPNVPIDVHVFALFNENMKPGPLSERNYGLFYPNQSPVYNVGFQAAAGGSGGGSGSGSSSYTPPPPGYFPEFTISAASDHRKLMDLYLGGVISLMVTALILFHVNAINYQRLVL